jgi:GNAT superfamily N-acetyltransferase
VRAFLDCACHVVEPTSLFEVEGWVTIVRGCDGSMVPSLRQPAGLAGVTLRRLKEGGVQVDIRRIMADDWEVLRELRLASLTDAPDAFGQRYEEAGLTDERDWMTTARASAKGDRRAWFIAYDNGVAVGLVQGRRRPPADCLLFSMWVAPGARRQGTGRGLVQAVEDWGREWGANRVVLWVIDGNDAAIRFYDRIGFKLLPAGPDAEAGRIHGALAMERRVAPD